MGKIKCAMCGGDSDFFRLETRKSALGYHRCRSCGFIGLANAHFPSRAGEKARYLLHQNNSLNSGYMEFLRFFLDEALVPYKKPGSLVLDYGSGPSPMLAQIAGSLDYRCDFYDPIFAKTRLWRKKSYDAILLHEVMEHVRNPSALLSFLAGHTARGGILAIRTRFLPAAVDDFTFWWYRMDPTHVSFFTPGSLTGLMTKKGFSLAALREPDIIVFRKVENPFNPIIAD